MNIFNLFIELSNINNKEVNYTLIKAISFLIQNIKDQTFLYFLFSNNFINKIISKNFALYGNDYFSMYVSLLKALSLRLDEQNIIFFYQEQTNTFPLIQCAIKIYNEEDSMVSAVVRNVILLILKINYPLIENHFVMLPTITYFSFISCYLRDLAIQLDTAITKKKGINSVIDNIVEQTMYLNDLFKCDKKRINYVLMNSLFYYLIMPALFGNFVISKEKKISNKVILFMINILLLNISNECFRNVLFTILFSDELSYDLSNCMNEPPDDENYSFKLNKEKLKNENFEHFICTNLTGKFIRSLIEQNNIMFEGIDSKISDELKEAIKKIKKNNEDDMNEVHNQVYNLIMNSLNEEETKKITDYHKQVSSALGIPVGIFESMDNKTNNFFPSFMYYMKDYYQIIKTKNIPKDSLVENSIQSMFLNLLNSSQESDILQENLIIHSLLNSNINSKLLRLIGKQSQVDNVIPNADITDQWDFNNDYISSIYDDKNIDSYSNYKIYSLLKNLMSKLEVLSTDTILLIIDNYTNLLTQEDNTLIYLENLFRATLKKIDTMIKNDVTCREKGFSLFKEQWKEYNKKYKDKETFNEYINNEYSSSIKVILKDNSSDDLFSKSLFISMVLQDTIKIIKKDDNFIRNKFPLYSSSIAFNINEEYIIKDKIKNDINMYSFKYQDKQDDNFETGKGFFYQSHFYIALYQPNNNSIIIKYKVPIVNVNIETEDFQNNVLAIQMKSTKIKIKCDNTTQYNILMNDIIETKEEVKNEEKSIFLIYYGDLLLQYEDNI